MANARVGVENPESARIGSCVHCHIPTYSDLAWRAMTKDERRNCGGRQIGGEGMCMRCWRLPKEKREPEPGAEFVEPICKTCGNTMVSRTHWRKADAAERAELADEGYVKAYGSDICEPCNMRLRHPLPDDPVKRAHSLKIRRGMKRDFIADYKAAVATGTTSPTEIAKILELDVNTVHKKLKVAREKGLIE